MRLGRTTVVHFASQVAVSLSGFLATFAIARELGPGPLGVYAVVVALVFWLNVPSTAVANALTKRVSEGGDADGYVAAAATLNLGIALVVFAGAVAARGPLAAYLGADLAVETGALVAANTGFLTVRGLLEGEKRVGTAGLLMGVERVLRTVVQVAAVVVGYEVSALVLGHMGSLVVAIGIGGVLAGSRLRRPTREDFRRLTSYARFAWLGTLRTRAFGWMDTVVLALFVPSTLIGIYEVSWNIASVFALVAVSVRQTLFPELSDLDTTGDHDRIHHYLNEGLVFTGVFVIPGLLGAAVVGERVLAIYRPEFRQGALVLVVLVFARSISAYGEQFVNAINAVDRPDLAFRINLVFVVANTALNLLLVWQYGWVGAAVATTVSAVLLAVAGHRGLTALIGRPDIPIGEIGRQVLAALGMAGAVLAVRPSVPPGHYWTLALVGFGVGTYVAGLLALSGRVRAKAVGLYRSVV